LRIKFYLFLAITFCAFLVIAQEAQSCSVPVFRYALERWKPDAYKGIYIYRGEISEEDKLLLQQLKEASANDGAPLNLIFREVDVEKFSKEKLTKLLQGPIPDTLPVLVIWYPDQMGKKPPFLREKLTPSLVKDLRLSPKRQQMAESLIKGESIVWVFIPSGNNKKDESTLVFIGQELDTALKKYARNPFSILSGAKRKKLTYGFPILTLLRDDPAERIFIETLMKSESDLYEHTDEPMVFPVFGRGRVLGCLFGEYITKKNIREATAFLSGACSCEVKELNPGVDLLVAAPWDMVVMNSFVEDTPLPELTGVMPEPDEAAGTEDTSPEVDITPEDNSSLFTIYAVSLSGVILIAGILGFIISRRRSE
jgi:hypothetical protein